MANIAKTADHLLTKLDFNIRYNPPDRGIEKYGRHVVEFIGTDKPWSLLGTVAIQMFKLDEPCIYFIGPDDGPIKIGLSNAPLERLACFQIGSPVTLKIHALTKGDFAAEQAYHARFAAHRLHGEWFNPHPDILAAIDRLRALSSRDAV